MINIIPQFSHSLCILIINYYLIVYKIKIENNFFFPLIFTLLTSIKNWVLQKFYLQNKQQQIKNSGALHKKNQM